jgi:hypothetical protein
VSPLDLHEVRHGLAIVQWGFRLVAGAVVAWASLTVFAAIYPSQDSERWDVLLLFGYSGCLSLLSAFAGVIVGLHGRVCCLDTPPEMPVARVRIRPALLLEACGLLSGLVNAGVGCAVVAGAITMPVEVFQAVFGFAAVLCVAGRAFFVAYTFALARAVELRPAPRPSLAAVMLIVTGSTAVTTAVGLQLTAGHRPLTFDELLPVVVTFSGAVCVFSFLYTYGRWLRRLREAVSEYDRPPAEHL